jgi:hypothetical protein
MQAAPIYMVSPRHRSGSTREPPTTSRQILSGRSTSKGSHCKALPCSVIPDLSTARSGLIPTRSTSTPCCAIRIACGDAELLSATSLRDGQSVSRAAVPPAQSLRRDRPPSRSGATNQSRTAGPPAQSVRRDRLPSRSDQTACPVVPVRPINRERRGRLSSRYGGTACPVARRDCPPSGFDGQRQPAAAAAAAAAEMRHAGGKPARQTHRNRRPVPCPAASPRPTSRPATVRADTEPGGDSLHDIAMSTAIDTCRATSTPTSSRLASPPGQ